MPNCTRSGSLVESGKRLAGMAGGGARHQGAVARVSGESRHVTLDDVLDTLEEPAFLLVLDGIQDPHNLVPACASPMPLALMP